MVAKLYGADYLPVADNWLRLEGTRHPAQLDAEPNMVGGALLIVRQPDGARQISLTREQVRTLIDWLETTQVPG